MAERSVNTSQLGSLGRPFIVAVITDRDVATAAETMRQALSDGADAFEVNLPTLSGASPASLAALLGAAPAPAYTSCRRRAFMTAYGLAEAEMPDWPDDERMERQLALVAAGSVAIDIELDTFDPRPAPPPGSAAAEAFASSPGEPAEVTWSPTAIERQREVAATARSLGAQALFSCHTGRPQAVDGLLRIADAAVARGADLLKIVTPCRDRADLLAVLSATTRLAAELSIPFTLVGAGAAGGVTRIAGAAFGSAWLLGRPAGAAYGFAGQPLVGDLRRVVRLLVPASSNATPSGQPGSAPG